MIRYKYLATDFVAKDIGLAFPENLNDFEFVYISQMERYLKGDTILEGEKAFLERMREYRKNCRFKPKKKR